MIASVQYDFNANSFLNKEQKSKNFLIQITKYNHIKYNKKKFIRITVR